MRLLRCAVTQRCFEVSKTTSPSLAFFFFWLSYFITIMDADDVSLQNGSPRWEPGPACYSSCRSVFTEAAAQGGGGGAAPPPLLSTGGSPLMFANTSARPEIKCFTTSQLQPPPHQSRANLSGNTCFKTTQNKQHHAQFLKSGFEIKKTESIIKWSYGNPGPFPVVIHQIPAYHLDWTTAISPPTRWVFTPGTPSARQTPTHSGVP